jgi:hypothetical protein
MEGRSMAGSVMVHLEVMGDGASGDADYTPEEVEGEA